MRLRCEGSGSGVLGGEWGGGVVGLGGEDAYPYSGAMVRVRPGIVD